MLATNQRTLEQVEAEIAQTKEALANVKGTDTEVYARIVGYYRSVRNWNKGKQHKKPVVTVAYQITKAAAEHKLCKQKHNCIAKQI